MSESEAVSHLGTSLPREVAIWLNDFAVGSGGELGI